MSPEGAGFVEASANGDAKGMSVKDGLSIGPKGRVGNRVRLRGSVRVGEYGSTSDLFGNGSAGRGISQAEEQGGRSAEWKKNSRKKRGGGEGIPRWRERWGEL